MKLLTIFTQMFTITASILMALAYSYDELGYGLHPYLALPLSTLFLMAPYMVDHWFIEIIDDELSPSYIKRRDPRADAVSAPIEELFDEEHPQTLEDYQCADREQAFVDSLDNATREYIERTEMTHFGDPDKKTGIYVTRVPMGRCNKCRESIAECICKAF